MFIKKNLNMKFKYITMKCERPTQFFVNIIDYYKAFLLQLILFLYYYFYFSVMSQLGMFIATVCSGIFLYQFVFLQVNKYILTKSSKAIR